jgi:hypothetical protein
MVARKNEKEGASRADQTHEKVAIRVNEAANAIREIIRTVGIGVEDKIAFQDKIDNISKEAESVLDRIDSFANKNQRKLLIAYENFLERNLEAVRQRLKELG